MNTQLAVLYVEDDPLSRTVMEMLLSGRMGMPNVTMFEDSTDFEKRVQALSPTPDVVFLDIHLKPYNGFEMLEMLRGLEAFRSIPIVALTASVMNEEVDQLRMAGFHSCLAKPIDADTFPDTLDTILSGKSVWRVLD